MLLASVGQIVSSTRLVKLRKKYFNDLLTCHGISGKNVPGSKILNLICVGNEKSQDTIDVESHRREN